MSQNIGLLCEGIVGAVRVRWVLGRDLSLWKPWKRSEGRYDSERACLVENRGYVIRLSETRVVFSILENQRRVSHMKTKECICWWHCDGIVLAMACGIPCASSGIPGILLGIAIGIAPVIALMTSAQPQSSGLTFFFLYFLSFLFFYIYS